MAHTPKLRRLYLEKKAQLHSAYTARRIVSLASISCLKGFALTYQPNDFGIPHIISKNSLAQLTQEVEPLPQMYNPKVSIEGASSKTIRGKLKCSSKGNFVFKPFPALTLCCATSVPITSRDMSTYFEAYFQMFDASSKASSISLGLVFL